MKPELTEKDYEQIEKILQNVKSASNNCSDCMYRLSNGFSNMSVSSDWISERFYDGLNGWSVSALLKIMTVSDNLGCFEMTRFKRGLEKEDGEQETELEEVFDNFKNEAAEIIKDLERLREMIETSLKFVNTAIEETKEIQKLATTGRTYLKEKDKHGKETNSHGNEHS